MQDRIEALKILGLPEETASQDIERRYFHLVKKYKYLAHDEQPSLDEPIFSKINEAYRYLIGFKPMQKINFQELNWKEKLQHIREYYMVEITIVLVISLFVLVVGSQIHSFKNVLQKGTSGPGISSTMVKPLSNNQCESTDLP
jgi:preprotein translocase subunit Sec63